MNPPESIASCGLPEEGARYQETYRLAMQRLGSCLVRIQQYERLMREIVILSRVQGPLTNPKKALGKRRKKVRKMSLGALIQELSLNAIIRRDRADAISGLATESRMLDGDAGVHVFTVLSDAEHDGLCSDLEKLRVARNQLAHHFLEKFDVLTLRGCDDAIRHLEDFRETVDSALSRLRQFGERFDMARRAALLSLEKQLDRH